MREKLSPPVLVVSGSWRTRALLAAQIGESLDRPVISAPDVNGALKLMESMWVDPVAIVVDTARRVGPEDVALLLETRSRTPLVLVGGRLQQQAFAGVSRWCAACLVRPVHIGEIADTVGRVLDETGDLGAGEGSSRWS